MKSADRALFNVVFDQLKRTTRPPVTDIQELQRGARKAACNFIPITGHFYQKKKGGGGFVSGLVESEMPCCEHEMASPGECTTAKIAGCIVFCVPLWLFISDVSPQMRKAAGGGSPGSGKRVWPNPGDPLQTYEHMITRPLIHLFWIKDWSCFF